MFHCDSEQEGNLFWSCQASPAFRQKESNKKDSIHFDTVNFAKKKDHNNHTGKNRAEKVREVYSSHMCIWINSFMSQFWTPFFLQLLPIFLSSPFLLLQYSTCFFCSFHLYVYALHFGSYLWLFVVFIRKGIKWGRKNSQNVSRQKSNRMCLLCTLSPSFVILYNVYLLVLKTFTSSSDSRFDFSHMQTSYGSPYFTFDFKIGLKLRTYEWKKKWNICLWKVLHINTPHIWMSKIEKVSDENDSEWEWDGKLKVQNPSKERIWQWSINYMRMGQWQSMKRMVRQMASN